MQRRSALHEHEEEEEQEEEGQGVGFVSAVRGEILTIAQIKAGQISKHIWGEKIVLLQKGNVSHPGQKARCLSTSRALPVHVHVVGACRVTHLDETY